MTLIETAVDHGLLPDPVLRTGIRRLLRRRLAEIGAGDPARERARTDAWAEAIRRGPLVVAADAANEQHYEVPAAFYELVLGRHLKYSSAWFDDDRDDDDLDGAEAAMLELTCGRAGLEDGQRVLELGCGWGSLTLWMAERFPGARITALSNSASQRRFIEARAAERALTNLSVVTANVADFAPAGRFDRVVSVEMLEHVRNYDEMFRRVRRWLEPDGRLFFHVFAHRSSPYPFETTGDDDWMGKHFFTGGQMPSPGLFERFEDDLETEERWTVPGTHYARTAEAWRRRLDRNAAAVESVFAATYGPGEARTWVHRWRVFFLACAELFRFDDGREWFVHHARLRPTERDARRGSR